MARPWGVGTGVAQDIKQTLVVSRTWSQDWSLRGSSRILGATTYIFCASAIPALAFGEQLTRETDGLLSAVQVLAACAITGVMQAVVGGQPLLIVGVAEPIVLAYAFMYQFAADRPGLGRERFLAWAAWACVWAAAMIAALALTGACAYISRFTRFAGEVFGALIALLFLQQAVKGSVEEFQGAEPGASSQWQLVNGLWSLLLAFGLLLTSLLLRTARSWRFLRSPLRAFLADYGAALMLAAFSGLSFAVTGGGGSGGSTSVPRRVQSPNLWDTSTWTVAGDMGQLESKWIAGAIIPAALITVLFFFDHNVSAQLAQQAEFNLQRPPAYHWDFMLLGLMTVLCGLLGMPPVNGVLPQSPMHTNSLAKVAGSGSGSKQHQKQQQAEAASSGAETPESAVATQAAVGTRGSSIELESATTSLHASPSKQALLPGGSGSMAPPANTAAANGTAQRAPGAVPVWDPAAPPCVEGSSSSRAGDGDVVVSVHVYEQRWSGLLQSLGMAACLAAMPAIRLIPTAVLWGYFAFMAIESLPASQFWDRCLLLLTDPARRARLLERGHAPYLETVPFCTIAWFTAFQAVCLGCVYAVTWAGVAGILFPLPIMALVPLRHHVMPRFFRNSRHLQELDAAHEEQVAPLSRDAALREAVVQGLAELAAAPGGAPGGGEGEEGPPVELPLPDSEMQHLRVVHHLSRESLIHRRQSLKAAYAAAPEGLAPAATPRAAGAPLPGTTAAISPRSAASLRRRSHELGHV